MYLNFREIYISDKWIQLSIPQFMDGKMFRLPILWWTIAHIYNCTNLCGWRNGQVVCWCPACWVDAEDPPGAVECPQWQSFVGFVPSTNIILGCKEEKQQKKIYFWDNWGNS